jgi:CBS domain-containing protein
MMITQVMTPNPKACSMDDSLDRAAQIMWEHDCGCVPLVDAAGKAVGMITDRDVCMAAYTQGRALWQMSVGLAASRTLISVRETDSVDAAQKLMQENRVRRLPVVDAQGRLVGVLSMNDIARRAHTGHRHGDLSADSVVRTLAAICTRPAHAAAAE